MDDLSDSELLAELGATIEPVKAGKHTAYEERIIAAFEEIQHFVDQHGRIPQHGETRDIFERLYAIRLDKLRALSSAHTLLAAIDTQGLLDSSLPPGTPEIENLEDDELLAELGVMEERTDDIRILRHIAPREERRGAEEIANRVRCDNFEDFKSLFEQAEQEVKTGIRQTQPFSKNAKIQTGDFFILGGQIAYVAECGKSFKASNGERDARLRVIYSNGTESNLLLRSLQRALYKDDAGRRLFLTPAGPLFSEQWDENDIKSGTIYVLRSLSDHPFVAEHRELIHKIGVTSTNVERRIANAMNDPTYLLANVEVVASYKLAEINRTKLEKLFHRIFASAQIDLTIYDRFGHPIHPQEWFLVPLQVIDDVVRRISDGSITDMVYDPKTARLLKTSVE